MHTHCVGVRWASPLPCLRPAQQRPLQAPGQVCGRRAQSSEGLKQSLVWQGARGGSATSMITESRGWSPLASQRPSCWLHWSPLPEGLTTAPALPLGIRLLFKEKHPHRVQGCAKVMENGIKDKFILLKTFLEASLLCGFLVCFFFCPQINELYDSILIPAFEVVPLWFAEAAWKWGCGSQSWLPGPGRCSVSPAGWGQGARRVRGCAWAGCWVLF